MSYLFIFVYNVYDTYTFITLAVINFRACGCMNARQTQSYIGKELTNGVGYELIELHLNVTPLCRSSGGIHSQFGAG